MPDSRSQYEQAARTAARKYGIEESLYIRLITNESGWDPAASSSAGAIGFTQLMPDTAKSLGVNPYDPIQNLEGGAKYLAQMRDRYSGDMQKAIAAYVSGPGIVDKALDTKRILGGSLFAGQPGSIADNLRKDSDPNQWYSRWLNSLGDDATAAAKYVNGILSEAPSSSTAGGSGSADGRSTVGGYTLPKLEDFPVYGQDIDGAEVVTGYDVDAFNDAMAKFDAYTKGKDDDLASYLQSVIESIGAQIESGQLNVDKANKEFQRRMDAFTAGGDQFTNLLGYALPVGQEYVTGREPGGFYDKMGLAPKRASGMNYDPFAAANEIVNSTPNLMDIQTPQVGSDIFQQALQVARSAAAGGPGGMAGPPAPPPQPITTTIGNGISNTFQSALEMLKRNRALAGG
jgi:hypothetical protein